MFKKYNIYPGQIYYARNNKYDIEAEIISNKYIYIQISVYDNKYDGYIYYNILDKIEIKPSFLLNQKIIINKIDYDNYDNKLIITINNDALKLIIINNN